MKAKPLVKITSKHPLFKRGDKFILVRSFKDVGQKQVNLLTTDKRTAETRITIFLATAELMGFESALEELNGGKVIKKGDDLNFEGIEKAFEEYCAQLEEPPRDVSINGYLKALKRIMGDKTLSKVDIQKWKMDYLNGSKSATNKRSMVAEIRNAKVIFSKSCMNFYKRKNYTVINPFEHLEKSKAPKVEQYSPLAETVRKAIWEDCDKQEPEIALIVLLGLGLGLRRNEVEFARTDWFSVQDDCVVVSVKEETDFIPKSGEKRTFRISNELYERLLKNRQRILARYTGTKKSLDNDPYFVPVYRRKGEGKRLWKRFKDVSKWLKEMGVSERLPFHCLRKEAGSIHLQQNKNLLETSRFLGHSDPSVTATHYAGIIDPSIITGIVPRESPEETAAKVLGITVEQLRELQKSLHKKG
jgi:integrase